jgi:hypothetical protein
VPETPANVLAARMKMLASLLLTMLVGVLVFAISGSWLLTAITGLIGGFSWAHSQRTA